MESIDSNFLLGNKSSKRTNVYTHVNYKDFIRIKNPLDHILNRRRNTIRIGGCIDEYDFYKRVKCNCISGGHINEWIRR